MSQVITHKPAIVQVVSYYPPHLGGMENCVEQLATAFDARGYTVSVYTSNQGSAHAPEMQRSAVKIFYLKSIEVAHTPVIFMLFFRLLRISRRSLIHLHVAQAFAPEIVYLVAKLKSIPYIAHIHLDVGTSGFFGFLLEMYKRLFLKKVLHSATRVICLSELQKKDIAAKYALPLSSIAVVPNGVSEAYFVSQKTHEQRVPNLLFVGRLAVQKNLLFLIEAVAQMRSPFVLHIVGDGELRSAIEASIQKHGLSNIMLHGKQSGQQLIDLYRAADIFVLPSLKEGVSLAMLEALAGGLPVVASDSPEMRHILADCGVLIPDPTPARYAETLDALLGDPVQIQQLSACAIQMARAFSWVNTFDAIEKLYKEII